MAVKRRSKEALTEVGALVEPLRDFLRLNYLTAAEVAREIGVHDSTVYRCLLGRARPAETRRINAFLDSFPRQKTGPAVGQETVLLAIANNFSLPLAGQ
jgi:hypothetical protein